MGFIILMFIYGVPAILAIVGIAFLIRSATASKRGANTMSRKAKRLVSYATIVDKIHYYTTAPNGFYDIYYITFLLDESDRLSLKVSKSLLKKVNVGDKVKLHYEGEKFISLEIIQKTGVKTEARDVHVTNWKQIS